MKEDEAYETENENQISLLEKWRNQMKLIQEKTGIKGSFVIFGLILSVIFVYFNIFDSIITNLVGTLYPAFWTIKSLEQNIVEEQKKWLTYWVVFGSFIILDMSSVIISKFIPIYFVLKILFLIWLFMPGSNGCTIVYYLVVKKIFRFYEDKIDSYVIGAKDYANNMFSDNNLKSFQNKKNLLKKNFKNKEDIKENKNEDKKEKKNEDKKEDKKEDVKQYFKYGRKKFLIMK